MRQIRGLVRQWVPFAARAESAARHFRSKRKIGRLLRNGAAPSIEVGAGNKRGSPPWITIDVTSGCDIYWDLRRGIPFPNATVQNIYSSHFLEHLSYAEIQIFLDECKRVLRPNGKFLICVPNARMYLEAYVSGRTLDTDAFYQPGYNRTTRIDYVNYTAYMAGQHKYMFDEENLVFILRAKGFKNARLRAFDPALDMQERDFESIYAEAES
jgi:predicted SAM-dependent methyltransferase